MPFDRFTLSAVSLVVDVAPGVLLAQALLCSLKTLSFRCGVILRSDRCCDESKYLFLPILGKADASLDELAELSLELPGRATLPAAVTWDRPCMPVSALVLLATGVARDGGAAVVAIGTAGEWVVPVRRSPAMPVCAAAPDLLDELEQLRGDDRLVPTLADLLLVGVGAPHDLPCVDPVGEKFSDAAFGEGSASLRPMKRFPLFAYLRVECEGDVEIGYRSCGVPLVGFRDGRDLAWNGEEFAVPGVAGSTSKPFQAQRCRAVVEAPFELLAEAERNEHRDLIGLDLVEEFEHSLLELVRGFTGDEVLLREDQRHASLLEFSFRQLRLERVAEKPR